MVKYEYFESLLKLKDKKISDVSKDTGVATATLIEWKNGKYAPKVEKLETLANYFDVPITYFFTGNIIEKQQNNFSNEDLLLARELNKTDKLDLIKDIIKIQKDTDVKILELMTKKILESQK